MNPADMRNANIITISKIMIDTMSISMAYIGISLLVVAGKILALVGNRMRDPIAETVLHNHNTAFDQKRLKARHATSLPVRSNTIILLLC